MVPEDPSDLAEAILEIRSNTEARSQFESKPNLLSFWMSKAAKSVKIAHEETVKILLPFRTTFLREQGFSTLLNVKTKNRNWLDAEDSIQIALISKSPNFEAIVSNMKQHQFSKMQRKNVFNYFFFLIFSILIYVCTTIIIICYSPLKCQPSILPQ